MKNIEKSTVVDFDEALRIVLDLTRGLGTNRVNIYDNCALNRILTESPEKQAMNGSVVVCKAVSKH